MRFKIDSETNMAMKKCKPHLWFAWRPVRIAPDEIAWLEQVIRTGRYYWRHNTFRGARRKWNFKYQAVDHTALQERGREDDES